MGVSPSSGVHTGYEHLSRPASADPTAHPGPLSTSGLSPDSAYAPHLRPASADPTSPQNAHMAEQVARGRGFRGWLSDSLHRRPRSTSATVPGIPVPAGHASNPSPSRQPQLLVPPQAMNPAWVPYPAHGAYLPPQPNVFELPGHMQWFADFAMNRTRQLAAPFYEQAARSSVPSTQHAGISPLPFTQQAQPVPRQFQPHHGVNAPQGLPAGQRQADQFDADMRRAVQASMESAARDLANRHRQTTADELLSTSAALTRLEETIGGQLNDLISASMPASQDATPLSPQREAAIEELVSILSAVTELKENAEAQLAKVVEPQPPVTGSAGQTSAPTELAAAPVERPARELEEQHPLLGTEPPENVAPPPAYAEFAELDGNQQNHGYYGRPI